MPTNLKTVIQHSGGGQTPPKPGYILAPAGPCENPKCKKIVPQRWVFASQKHRCCDKLCRSRMYNSMHVIGTCEYCGKPVTGYLCGGRNPRFDSKECEAQFHTERLLGPTDAFSSIINRYLSSTIDYRATTLPDVRLSLAHFFAFVVHEGVTRFEDVRPSMITKWIKHERDRGITRGNFIGHISTFFGWLIVEEIVDMSNPVIPRRHNQSSGPTAPRPYSAEEVKLLWDLLIEHGDLLLLVSFAIGNECGLRVGEVANIRLADVDLVHKKIFVRLPTKNMKTRTVPFRHKVAKYIPLWLARRNPKCSHDHLIHGDRMGIYDTSDMSGRFRRFFSSHPEAARIFKFHRCRHTWATNLLNNGMNLAVLQKLGGWTNLNSLQRYIQILPETIRREYESACKKLEESPQPEPEESMSLIEFAALEEVN
jgi:integrase